MRQFLPLSHYFMEFIMLKSKSIFRQSLLATLVLTVSGVASAAAFQLSETSTSGLGRAFAGEAAVADNASVVATNPALMTKFNRPEVSFGAVIFRPKISVDGKIDSTGQAVHQGNATPREVVPMTYGVLPVNDNFVLGMGVNANFGLSTEYDGAFGAGFLGGRTHIEAINTNFSGAYKYNNWSFGAGLNVVYTKAEVKRTVGDLPDTIIGAIKNQQAKSDQSPAQVLTEINNKLGLTDDNAITPQQAMSLKTALASAATNPAIARKLQQVKDQYRTKTLARLSGDNISFGVNLGVTYDFDADNRIGFAYHSPIIVRFKGKFKSDLPTVSTLQNSAVFRQGAGMLNGLVTPAQLKALGDAYTNKFNPQDGGEVDGKLKLVLPDYAELSGYNRFAPNLALTYSVKWTNWSRFKQLHATSDAGKTLFTKDEYFKDTWRYALGLIYDYSSALTLRTGVAYDTSAVGNYYTISIPDTDRLWATVGATYHFTPNLSVDAAYAYIHGKKSHFTEDKGHPTSATFDVKSKAQLYGLNLNYRF